MIGPLLPNAVGVIDLPIRAKATDGSRVRAMVGVAAGRVSAGKFWVAVQVVSIAKDLGVGGRIEGIPKTSWTSTVRVGLGRLDRLDRYRRWNHGLGFGVAIQVNSFLFTPTGDGTDVAHKGGEDVRAHDGCVGRSSISATTTHCNSA